MASDQIEEIKRKVDIVEVVNERVPLKKSGRNYKAPCPFHSEKTPSFMVSQELQIFKCFGCGIGGDVYKFLMEFEKIDFPQALKILADRAGVKLEPLRGFPGFAEKDELLRANHTAQEFYHFVLSSHRLGTDARLYLQKRGVKEETIKTFKLGFAPDRMDSLFGFLSKKRGIDPSVLEKAGLVVQKDKKFYDRFRARILFPLNDHYGNTLGFSGRIIREQGDLAKYINTPETLLYKKGRLLYGLDVTKNEIKKEGAAVVVEGEFDLMSLFQIGVKNVVAIKGSAFTEDQAILLSRFCPQVFLALDSDFAGDQAARRGIEILEKVGLETRVVRLKDFKDPDEAAQKDPVGFKEKIKSSVGIYDFLIDSIFEKIDTTTTEGKAKISRQVSPILSGIQDEIVKSDFSRKVAERLGVPHEAVLAQVRKQEVKRPTIKESDQEPGVVDRRRILEERLLRLLLQNKPDELKNQSFTDYIKSSLPRRIVDHIQNATISKLKIEEIAKSLPPELVDFFSSLIMIEETFEEARLSQEIQDTLRSIKILDTKEEINNLTNQLKDAGKEREQEILAEITQLTKSLSALESGIDIVQ